mgnify:CR=1 FL=1
MNRHAASLVRLVIAMLIYGTIGVCRRALPVSSAFLSMFRGLAGSLFLVIYLIVRRQGFDCGAVKRKLLPLLVSGSLIGLNWILLFESYHYTTVAIATLCYYMSPVFVMVASPLLLRKPLERRKVVSLILSLMGMLLITGIPSGTSLSSGQFLGILLGLGAAVLYAAVVLINQHLTDVRSLDRTLVQLFSAGLVMLPYTLLTGGMEGFDLTLPDWLLLLVIALVHTCIAYVLYFSSMDGLSAQSVVVISYLDPLTAVLLSALVLHEPMNAWSIVGTVLILFAAIFAELGPADMAHLRE